VTVHLVRHGQSTWNVEGRLQGQTPHPELTDLGRAQAAKTAEVLRDRLTGVNPARVRLVSSDLVRAEQTAEIIAEALDLPFVVDAALREQGLGVLEGRLTSELTAEPTPEGLDVTEVRWGGGESIEDVHRRLGAFLEEVLEEVLEEARAARALLVLVTHGDTLGVAKAWLEGRSHREVAWEVVPNGSVVTVTWPPAPSR